MHAHKQIRGVGWLCTDNKALLPKRKDTNTAGRAGTEGQVSAALQTHPGSHTGLSAHPAFPWLVSTNHVFQGGLDDITEIHTATLAYILIFPHPCKPSFLANEATHVPGHVTHASPDSQPQLRSCGSLFSPSTSPTRSLASMPALTILPNYLRSNPESLAWQLRPSLGRAPTTPPSTHALAAACPACWPCPGAPRSCVRTAVPLPQPLAPPGRVTARRRTLHAGWMDG